MDNEQVKQKVTIPVLMQRLDEMYEKEEAIIKQMNILKLQFEQLQDDKELLQNMIMHQSNKTYRSNANGFR